ncbi:MAG: hypothetical protein K2N56_06085 [Oscillospiraceae bacterium]|nr:hypothetical protein [Oscillospiraceae bacterium]
MHLLCKCGCDMWNGRIPNDIEFSVYSDKRMCEILENDTVDTLDLAQMNDYDVWKCPDCGRLYVFEKSSCEVLCIYKPEDITDDQ